jgi:hypothetical protein
MMARAKTVPVQRRGAAKMAKNISQSQAAGGEVEPDGQPFARMRVTPFLLLPSLFIRS